MRKSFFRESNGIEMAGCERGAEVADGPRGGGHKEIVSGHKDEMRERVFSEREGRGSC